MARYEFVARDALSYVDDVEVACRSLAEQFELAEGEIDALEDKVETLNARIAELEAELAEA